MIQSPLHAAVAATLFVAVLAAAGPGLAGDAADATFLRTEFEVLGPGASARWLDDGRHYQIGGQGLGGRDEFGTRAPKVEEKKSGAPSDVGRKVKAGLFSAVLPGAGQYYTGHKGKAYIMGGVEVAIWTAWFVFDKQGDNKRDDAEEWAGLYAGTSGEHGDRYWQNVGHYADSDAYNESVLREARALGEDPSGLVGTADAWQWVNADRQLSYAQLRADGNSAYDRRDFMILFAVVNRVVSVVDAVIGAGGQPGAVQAEELGLDMKMEMLPSWRDPGARCVVSRSF